MTSLLCDYKLKRLDTSIYILMYANVCGAILA